MITVALIDDEPMARQGLREMLARHTKLVVVGEAGSVPEARKLIDRAQPQVLFLDIRMPGANGFELLKGLTEPPKVVFATAYANHAVEAFEFEAVDYLLKPIRARRLGQAVRRLETLFGAEPTEADSPLGMSDRLCLRTPGRTLVARLEDVAALEADGDFTRIHVAGEKPLMICQTLGSYQSTLPSPPFHRLDRSLMINLNAYRSLEEHSRDRAELNLEGVDRPFTLGRQARLRLRKLKVS